MKTVKPENWTVNIDDFTCQAQGPQLLKTQTIAKQLPTWGKWSNARYR